MRPLVLLLLAFSLPAEAGTVRNKIADACSRLSGRDPDLTKNCVNHAELYDLDSGFINAVAGFHPTVEVRVKALKSGANVDTLNLCKNLGWSVDNTLSCMRSYPTPELLKECKKLSPKQDDQLRCVREGRDTGQVNACISFSENVNERFECLKLNIPTLATLNCRNLHQGYQKRLKCLHKEVLAREDQYKRDQAEMNARWAELKKDPAYGDPSMVPPSVPRRMPASASNSK